MRIGLIGCGRMGSALIKGAIEANVISASNILLHSRTAESAQVLSKNTSANITKNNAELAKHSTVILLGCKPAQVAPILSEIKNSVNPETLIISIAAGISLNTMEAICNEGTRIIRVMPNTPSLIGFGAAGMAAGKCVTPTNINAAKTLFEAVGDVHIVEEFQLDAVTGLSGSGPAYVYNFIDSLAAQGVKEGLSYETALALASQTVVGAAKMIQTTGETPRDLINQVTSPGGTTLAGLAALSSHNFEQAVAAGMHAATERSREIAKGSS